jgi:hypothetical protein
VRLEAWDLDSVDATPSDGIAIRGDVGATEAEKDGSTSTRNGLDREEARRAVPVSPETDRTAGLLGVSEVGEVVPGVGFRRVAVRAKTGVTLFDGYR